MIANPYGQYRDVQVQTASPGRLLVMLYDGAIRFCNMAKQGLTAHDTKLAHEGFRRTQDIIDYLIATLDMQAGDIARNLASLYDFMGRRLLEAHLHRDPKGVDDTIRLLETIRMAYAEIGTSVPQSRAGQMAGGVVPAVSNLG